MTGGADFKNRHPGGRRTVARVNRASQLSV
jgi:hypothetical protein